MEMYFLKKKVFNVHHHSTNHTHTHTQTCNFCLEQFLLESFKLIMQHMDHRIQRKGSPFQRQKEMCTRSLRFLLRF